MTSPEQEPYITSNLPDLSGVSLSELFRTAVPAAATEEFMSRVDTPARRVSGYNPNFTDDDTAPEGTATAEKKQSNAASLGSVAIVNTPSI